MRITPLVSRKRLLTAWILFSALLATTTASFTQISINKEDLLVIMGAGRRHYATAPQPSVAQVNIGGKGGPHVYDFSGISFAPMYATNNYLVDSIPVLAVRFPSGATTFGVAPDTIENNPVLMFANDTMYQVGKASLGSYYRFRHFVPYAVIMPFPVNYLQSFSRFCVYYDTTYNTSWQVTIARREDQPASSVVDGYGTLKVLGHEAPCLRIRVTYPQYNDVALMYVTKAGILLNIDLSGSEPDTGLVTIGDLGVVSSEKLTGVTTGYLEPKEFALAQNYPNPFNPVTTIGYTIAGTGHEATGTSWVKLAVYDMLGREVTVLVNEEKEAGFHEVRFDASGLSSGVYFYRLQVRPLNSSIGRDSKSGAGGFVQTRTLLILR